MNLKTYSEHTQIIRTVRIYVLKMLISPVFEGNTGGWFSCPTALQAKINYMLQTQPPIKNLLDTFKEDYYGDLTPRFLRKYYIYLNSIDGSQSTIYIDTNAIDLWEHVSPGELIKDGKYINIRDWGAARSKLEKANRFFTDMETKGLMKGAKAYPTEAPKDQLEKVFYDQNTRKYRIYFKRSQEYHSKQQKKKFLQKSPEVFTEKS
jgi:hypothetical protein